MSSRVTRSSAKKSANSSPSTSDPPNNASDLPPSKKRKASSKAHPADSDATSTLSESPHHKRRKQTRFDPVRTGSHLERESNTASMGSSPPYEPSPDLWQLSPKLTQTSRVESGDDGQPPASLPSSSKKKPTKSKKPVSPDQTSTSKRKSSSSSKKQSVDSKKGSGVDEESAPRSSHGAPAPQSAEGEEEGHSSQRDEDEEAAVEDDIFSSGGLPTTHSALAAMRAMAGMVSGMSSRLRALLEELRRKDDPSAQLTALSELSDLLLVSTEDNLAGHFSPDQYVKELVTLMQSPDDGSDGNQEIMTTACRCIANLIEALPPATATVVYNGAVPVLVEKLLNIMYMDLAEQALTTLEKISVEFPASIVREGGLTACLQFLDFFPTAVQRTAVTTAANCCRNIPDDSLSVVKDVMPNLLGVLNSNDQRVVEQGSLCISRIVDSFKYDDAGLEDLMDADILKAVLRLLLPGSTNLVGAHIHTQFLRVLSTVARASPSLTGELFKMNVTDTLYQILTGVSPPSDEGNVAQKIDSVMIMQALIHRPRDQVFETLTVICELLPGLDRTSLGFINDLAEHAGRQPEVPLSKSRKAPINKRREILSTCKNELRRFATVLMPTLTDAYSSTVNVSVRQRVLTAQLKMLSNLDQDILEDALRSVSYASFLASILSQPDHPFLVTAALQAADLLLKRLPLTYRHQFFREGVIAEVKKLAERPLDGEAKAAKDVEPASLPTSAPLSNSAPSAETNEPPHSDDRMDEDDDEEGVEDEEENSDGDGDSDRSSIDQTANESHLPNIKKDGTMKDMLTNFAKQFVSQCDADAGKDERRKAGQILGNLNALVAEIADSYDGGDSEEGFKLFGKLAKSFEGNAFESLTSYELISSNVVQTLLDVLDPGKGALSSAARAAFVRAFMCSAAQSSVKTSSSASPSTSFSILVQKLQDLFSRAEHFEVVTVNSSPGDNSRSSAASMLAKQVRIKLVAEGDESGIPSVFRHIMVSIHAIATLKALDEYLRPRMSLSDRVRNSRVRNDAASTSSSPAVAGQRLSGVIPPEDFLSRRLASTPAPPQGGLLPPSLRSSTDPTKPARPSDREATEDSLPGPSPSTATPKSRRSARKHKDLQPQTPSAPNDGGTESQQPLECADEERLSDEDGMKGDEELDAVIDEFEEEVEGDEADPSAVSMEIGSSGRVTARQDDGTRVSTPTRPPGPPSGAAGRPLSSSMARSLFGLHRPMSYSAAIQATPTDWHLEFSVNGKPIPSEVTIYRAIHTSQPSSEESSHRSVWSNVHQIGFKKVPGPPPEPVELTPLASSPPLGDAGIPQSLDQNPTTAVILRLLNILHDLNANIDEVIGSDQSSSQIHAEPLSQFVNTKLTAKMNRQLEEPLIVASNSLPNWSEDLARLYPFLFPFETRHLFLQSTSFGYSRSINRWQNAQPRTDSRHRHRDERPFLGRLQRQKVRISRSRILESAIKVMDLYGASPSILEVEYFEEVGTGLGPTLEFYSSVSKEFSNKKLHLWRQNESAQTDEYAFGKRGLFPAPMSEKEAGEENGQRVLMLFRTLGKFMARSMLDSRIVDLYLNPTFFKVNAGTDQTSLTLAAVKAVDEDLANSLQTLKQFVTTKKKILEQERLTPSQKAQKLARIQVRGASIDEMSLDFTLPGYPSIELIQDGGNIPVTIDNIDLYIDKVIEWTLSTGIHRQLVAFQAGFTQVFPYLALRAFTPDELCMLFGRAEEDWSMETLMDSIKADHGYNLDSPAVRNLLTVMSNLAPQSRRDFLQFVTGSPKLPIGGFKSLTPMFTVVSRPAEPGHTPDEYLPSCMTCVNYLKLPNYSSLEIMEHKLGIATKEGQGAFHLS